METNSNKKKNALLPLGIVFMVLGITIFKDAATPKYLMLGASIIMLGYSVYLRTTQNENNEDKK